MKVSKEHLEVLTEAITPFDKEEHRQAYRERRIPRADTVQDIDMRYRWDLFWAAGGGRLFAGDDTFNEYTTAHLDTALRRIVPAL